MQCLMGGWWRQYSFRCQPVDYTRSHSAVRVSKICIHFAGDAPRLYINKRKQRFTNEIHYRRTSLCTAGTLIYNGLLYLLIVLFSWSSFYLLQIAIWIFGFFLNLFTILSATYFRFFAHEFCIYFPNIKKKLFNFIFTLFTKIRFLFCQKLN